MLAYFSSNSSYLEFLYPCQSSSLLKTVFSFIGDGKEGFYYDLMLQSLLNLFDKLIGSAAIFMVTLALKLQGIGCTKITKSRNDESINGNVETRAYLEKKLVFCFGSYVASELLLPFGEENILSSSELKDAQEVVNAFHFLFFIIIVLSSDFNWSLVQIATRMVIQYGWGPDDSPTIYHHGTAVYI